MPFISRSAGIFAFSFFRILQLESILCCECELCDSQHPRATPYPRSSSVTIYMQRFVLVSVREYDGSRSPAVLLQHHVAYAPNVCCTCRLPRLDPSWWTAVTAPCFADGHDGDAAWMAHGYARASSGLLGGAGGHMVTQRSSACGAPLPSAMAKDADGAASSWRR